jgi:dihydroorotate dehydrogenase (NAD+) catalytic subunit
MVMVELAPRHKVGLGLSNPIMPAAGCFGLGAEYAGIVEIEPLGAVVVGPITAGPRRGPEPPRLLAVAGGALVIDGLANPGVDRAVRGAENVWQRSSVPVIVHVSATGEESAVHCCSRLSAIDAVAAVELGLPEGASTDFAEAVVAAAKAVALQPLIVKLPHANVARLAEAAVGAGADALTLCSPPSGTVWHEPSGRYCTGGLYGPFVLPLVLTVVRDVRERVPVPLVACGGIQSADDAMAVLRAGASAAQVTGTLWRDPASLTRIARALSTWRPEACGRAPG